MISASKLRDIFQHRSEMAMLMLNKPRIHHGLIAVIFYILITVILIADLMPNRVSLEAGQVSENDIVAPRAISYVDKEKTKKLEQEVMQSVASVYEHDLTVASKVDEDVVQLFSQVRLIQIDKNLSKEQKIDRLQKTMPISLLPVVIGNLLEAPEADLGQVEETTRIVLRRALQRGVKADELGAIRASLVLEPEFKTLNSSIAALAGQISQSSLKHNFLYNERETEKRRLQAISGIEPVRVLVKKGQIIIRHGEIATPEHIIALEELGLQKGQSNYLRMAGIALIVVMLFIVMHIYMSKYTPQVYEQSNRLVLLGLIVVSILLCSKAIHFYSDYLVPVATGALLVAILIDTRLGIFVACLLGIFAGIIAENDFRVAMVAIVGGVIGVFGVSKLSEGYSLTRTGLIISLSNLTMILALALESQATSTVVLKQGIAGMVNGIGSAILTIGCLPYLENTFKITTAAKLLALAKPNQPLLQRLLLEAPGTYHHSIVVGNLAEAAADSIGADPVLVRVGAYYHDIGKIKRPYFFNENQLGGDNPHDKIAPGLSTLIITSHIKDGVELALEHHLPEAIIDIIKQHHGTMLVSYFYKRAVDTEHSECINEEDFRYEGPTPRSKEAALVMLADCIEATVRSLSKPTVNRIEATVRKLIRERLHEGQLDECGLTLKDLNTIGDVFIKVLTGIFHSRIEYPEGAIKEVERRKTRNGNCIK